MQYLMLPSWDIAQCYCAHHRNTNSTSIHHKLNDDGHCRSWQRHFPSTSIPVSVCTLLLCNVLAMPQPSWLLGFGGAPYRGGLVNLVSSPFLGRRWQFCTRKRAHTTFHSFLSKMPLFLRLGWSLQHSTRLGRGRLNILMQGKAALHLRRMTLAGLEWVVHEATSKGVILHYAIYWTSLCDVFWLCGCI